MSSEDQEDLREALSAIQRGMQGDDMMEGVRQFVAAVRAMVDGLVEIGFDEATARSIVAVMMSGGNKR